MAVAIIDDSYLTAIADAIRNKRSSTVRYKPSEMADAILAITTNDEGNPFEELADGDTDVSVDLGNATKVPKGCIPNNVAHVSGTEVTAIAAYAFTDNNSSNSKVYNGSPYKIKTYNFPKLATIGDYAFIGSYLTDIVLPASVSSLGKSCFAYCSKATSISFAADVETIPENAFTYCQNLAGTLALPDRLKEIKDYAFSYCTKLDFSGFPGNLTSIGVGAFQYSGFSGEIVIPSIPLNISVFQGCTKLTGIVFQGEQESIPNSFCDGDVKIQSVTLPQALKSIDPCAFRNNRVLAEIVFPATLEEIEQQAFQYCYALQTLDFPDSLKNIFANSFGYCTGLKTVTFHEKASLYSNSFYNCSNITDIYVPWAEGKEYPERRSALSEPLRIHGENHLWGVRLSVQTQGPLHGKT